MNDAKTAGSGGALSAEWFESLRDATTRHAEEFRDLGFVDTRFAIRATDAAAGAPAATGLVFDTFECERVVALQTAQDLERFDPDFVLEAPDAVWREMLENVRRNGKADLAHTINTLVLSGATRLSSNDQLREDLFYRYNGSLQLFFDLAAEVPSPAAA
ncbi:MAG: hypothetical protein HYY35_03545 [Deltaproteobacteria bacterium]|nr:hypothetical protein [Deltaproteobacteria bacterium]